MTTASLALLNGRVHSFAVGRPRGPAPADAVAVAHGKILAVGSNSRVKGFIAHDTEVLDCAGRAIIPGIVDPHCHVLAAARRINRVDCRPSSAPDIDSIVGRLRDAARTQPGWIRGYGYDDSPSGIGRHLNRRDLDAVSMRRPVRVDHRSGHACVLNSPALAAVGISAATPDPPGSVIRRNAHGEPTGLLMEMSDWLARRIPEAGWDSIREGIPGVAVLRELSSFAAELLGYGITSVTDAGPANDLRRWKLVSSAVINGAFPLELTMMPGWTHLGEMLQAGLGYGASACNGMLRLGHAKIMLTASSGMLHPHPAELSRMIERAHEIGFPVAIHAVERDAVVTAALTLTDVFSQSPGRERPGRDRIEHCGECPPDVAELIRESGATVVTNPAFLYYDGLRYQQTVSGELLPNLYPVGSLLQRGIPVALASDAPVVESNPWSGMAAAVSRRSREGVNFGGIGLPSLRDALALHIGDGAIVEGAWANLAVVEPDPFSLPVAELESVRAAATVVRGNLVWQNGL